MKLITAGSAASATWSCPVSLATSLFFPFIHSLKRKLHVWDVTLLRWSFSLLLGFGDYLGSSENPGNEDLRFQFYSSFKETG